MSLSGNLRLPDTQRSKVIVSLAGPLRGPGVDVYRRDRWGAMPSIYSARHPIFRRAWPAPPWARRRSRFASLIAAPAVSDQGLTTSVPAIMTRSPSPHLAPVPQRQAWGDRQPGQTAADLNDVGRAPSLVGAAPGNVDRLLAQHLEEANGGAA
jgi:hypothetical protein